MTRSAESLLEELLSVDESTTIEAKAASNIGASIHETICAFANEPGLGGGYLLLGVARSAQAGLFGATYDVVGVANPDQIQADLASQCASVFNRPFRPQVSIDRLDGKLVLVVYVPELSPTEKPLFLTKLGLPRGAFRRVGSTDQHCTEDDLIALYQDHKGETYDSTAIKDADVSDFDAEAIQAYRELRAQANPVADELAWSDADLLRALGAVVVEGGAPRPTVAGLLLFGTAKVLRRCFPMMRIDYVRIPGREWVKDPDRRFDTVEIRSPLIVAARRAINAVRDDLPASFSLPEGEAIRTSETILPIRVLREAIVNAVMHRSYRIHGAIQILRYSNRIEIRNPGHSLKAEERLGEPGSQTRNPRIAAVLHDVHLAETKGSGIRAMRELMHENNLLPPTFESSRQPDHFVATFLFHHFLGAGDLAWLRRLTGENLSDEEARALVFVREVGAIDNAAYRSINHVETLAASAHLRRLRDLNLLEMRGSGNKTYYVPGTGFIREPEPSMRPAGLPSRQGGPAVPVGAADQHQPPPFQVGPGTDLHHLPADLHHPPAGSTPPPTGYTTSGHPRVPGSQDPRGREPSAAADHSLAAAGPLRARAEIGGATRAAARRPRRQEPRSPAPRAHARCRPARLHHPEDGQPSRPEVHPARGASRVTDRLSQQELESYLWGAAVILRGLVDAGDYKQFVFPLLFYKRLSDVWDEDCEQALAESKDDMAYATATANDRFVIPDGAHWCDVRTAAKDVGKKLQNAMRAIEAANPGRLDGIFGDAPWTNKERLPDVTLKNLLEHFAKHTLSLANVPEDELGNGYEFLIKKFADDSGHTAQEFYTNRTVVHLMVQMLAPKPGESIYDPTCGTGGMLISALAEVKRAGGEHRTLKLFGQERNHMTASIARMNLVLHGVEDSAIARGDTLAAPAFVEDDQLATFDVVVANPPYSIKQWNREAWTSDPWGRNFLGTPPQGRADYAFFQHILKSMDRKSGRCAILFPHGVLFRKEEAELRQKLIEADLVECVLGLGAGLFYNSPMEACVVVCRSKKLVKRRGKVLLIDAVNEVARERATSFLKAENQERIEKAYAAFVDEAGFAKVATREEIEAQGWSLSIPLYVERASTTTVPFGASGQPQTLQEAWTTWEESGRSFWIKMGSVVDMLDGLIGDEDGEAIRG